MGLPTSLFFVQYVATLLMTGLIWFVQVVHYPLFAEVGRGQLVRYETLHARRTGWVVFPPMVLELGTTMAALYPRLRPEFMSMTMALVLAGLIRVIWLTTAIGHVPLHTRLGQEMVADGTTTSVLGLLVRLNWLRTVAWTARAVLLTVAVSGALR